MRIFGGALHAVLAIGVASVIGQAVVSANAQGIKIGPDGVTIGGQQGGIQIGPGGIAIGRDAKNPARPSVSGSNAFTGSDFSGNDMRKLSLKGAVFQGSDLNQANFSGMDLTGIRFIGSDLNGANFSGANLSGALFQGTDLNGANLERACLLNATFTGVDANGANVRGAYLVGASLVGVDGSGVNLHEAIRQGPPRCPGVKSGAIKQRPKVTKAATIAKALSHSDGKIDLTVNFDTDSDKIRGQARAQLFEISKALGGDALKSSNIAIEGHTDAVGEDAYNIDLSYRRAISVMKSLAKEYGVASNRLSVAGKGESEPVANNDTDAGRAVNRRVVLRRN